METKRYRRVFSRLGGCFAAGTILIYLIIYGYSFLLAYLDGRNPGIWDTAQTQWLQSTDFQTLLSCVVVYGVGLPVIVLLAGKVPAEAPERHRMKWWQFLLALILCLAGMYLCNFLGLAITTLIGLLKGSPVDNSLLNVVTDGNPILNFVYMVICAPLMEEYVFRKVIVDRTARYGQGVAIVLSGLMFGLFHGNLNQFAYAAFLGMFFAFLYVKTGKLRITIALHMIVNFLGSVVATWLMKAINYEEYIQLDLTDTGAVMEFIMQNLAGWLLYLGYILFLLAIVLTGLVLFIVFACQRKFRLTPAADPLPGNKFAVIFLNPGMLVFCAVWLVIITVQLLS